MDADSFRFSAVIPQDESKDLFSEEITRAQVRLRGRGGTDIEVVHQNIIPFEQATLPSAALGWRGGGKIQVAANDPTGMQATEPFFRIDADLAGQDIALFHGASGLIRFSVAGKPLLVQWWRDLRQLLQRRYQL